MMDSSLLMRDLTSLMDSSLLMRNLISLMDSSLLMRDLTSLMEDLMCSIWTSQDYRKLLSLRTL